MIGVGAAIGLSPQQVYDCSLWELRAAAVGWAVSQGAKLDDSMSNEEMDEMLRQLGIEEK